MKKIICFIFLLLPVLLLNAQNWVRQYPFPEHETLYDIVMDTEGNGWAVGNNGVILHTKNSGVIWTSQTSPEIRMKLKATEIVPGTNGLKGFVGSDLLFQTLDGGENWLEVENGMSLVRKIQAFDKNNIVISGGSKGMRSSDGGSTWTEFSMGPKGANSAFFIDLDTGWIGSTGYNNAQVYITENGGENWTLVNDTKYSVIVGLHFLNHNTGFMASRDWILKTTDAGISWDTLNAAKLPSATDIHVVNEQEIWVTCNNGMHTHTTDGGVTWERDFANLNGSNSLQGVFANSDGKVWMTGKYTSVFYSENRGDSWKDQVSGQKGIINNVDFLTDKFGFAVGNNGIILKTSDGGAFWEDLSFQNIVPYLDVKIIDQNQIIILTSKKLLLSNDGGINWTEKSTDAVRNLTSFYVKSASEFYITSVGGEILRTIDSGSTWSSVYNQTGHLTGIEFIDSQNAIVTGYNGLILKSSDGGLTWQKKRSDKSNQFKNITFVSNLEGWIVPTNYTDTVFHTADGGETWEGKKINSKAYWQDITFMNADTGWIAGGSSGSGKIFKTIDGGESWNIDYTGNLNFKFINAPIQNEKTVWAGGAGGNIIKFSACSTKLNISNLEGDMFPCIGDTIFYEIQQSGVDVFSWVAPDDWVVFGNSNTAKLEIIVGSKSGQMTVKGANSCGDTTEVSSLQVSPKINSDIEIFEDNDILTSSSVANISKYKWLRYGEAVNGANSETFTPTTSGDYLLEVTFNSGCVKYSNKITFIITSVEPLISQKLGIFPNPANNRLFLNIKPGTKAKIKIIDMLGIMQYSSHVAVSSIDISYIKEGVYIVTLEFNEKKTVSKLLITR